jgi:hypothetical protein
MKVTVLHQLHFTRRSVLLFKARPLGSQYRKWLCPNRGCYPDAVLATSSIRMQTGAFDLGQAAFVYGRRWTLRSKATNPRTNGEGLLLISWHILVQIIWYTRSFLAVPADPGTREKYARQVNPWA